MSKQASHSEPSVTRRSFLRVVGGSALFSSLAPPQLFGASGTGARGVLVEAAGFAELGGWVLDTQHYQQMGGCYLLAHGMGVPVRPAKTTVTLPAGGAWKVWVRTRDWCPGDWEAPGQFRLRVDGRELETSFGTEEGWAWQAGGVVELKEAKDVEIELLDLTGFDGRCDALFFTRDEEPVLPNGDLKELTAWKDRLSGRAKLDVEEDEFDVVIVGGGISGCAAALAARKEGLKVALIQDRPLFGGNASEEVRVHTIGISAKAEDINPLFPALRSGPTAAPGAARQKQFPSSPPPGPARGKSLMKRGLEHQFHKSFTSQFLRHFQSQTQFSLN